MFAFVFEHNSIRIPTDMVRYRSHCVGGRSGHAMQPFSHTSPLARERRRQTRGRETPNCNSGWVALPYKTSTFWEEAEMQLCGLAIHFVIRTPNTIDGVPLDPGDRPSAPALPVGIAWPSRRKTWSKLFMAYRLPDSGRSCLVAGEC